ncbi:YcxB family protein [Streptomyces sp. NPDC001407]|uniref:YcxB family protein n=1 Tax=unclassified Streptomyces TaxID=2593676 RepID=UPI00341023E4
MSETLTSPAAGSVTFAYELTVADFRSALRARGRAVRSARAYRRVALVLWAGNAAAVVFTATRHGFGGVSGGQWGLVAGLALVLAVQSPRWQARQARARLDGPRWMTLDAGGLSISSAQSSQAVAWPHFGSLLEREDVFVLLSADKGRCLTILPKRALTGPGDLDRVRALLEAYVPRG